MKKPTVMVIAGEASGDLHGSGLVRELKRCRPDCVIYGIGGDKMRAAGMELIYHIREISVMGFWEVIRHLPLIRSVEKTLETLLKARRPDVVVLIDYPGFNLRFARVAKAMNIPIVYYISPQVWAWNSGRVKKMRGLIDKMLVVFPFEVDIYRKEGIDAEFVGHPLLEVLSTPQEKPEFCKRYGLDPSMPILALIPGSRKQELERIFPSMLGAARILNQQHHVQAVVAVASVLEMEYVRSFVRDDFPVQLLQHATYDVMHNADLAIVTSGTATLETGYFRTPMIVVYKTSFLTYLIGRMLVRIKNIGLVNIVAGKQVVPEMIQGNVNPHKLSALASAMLRDQSKLQNIENELGIIRERLGTLGASERVAQAVLAFT